MSKNLLSDVCHRRMVTTHLFFLVSRNTDIELGKCLRKFLENRGQQMRKACVCSFADCNFAMRRGAVCSRSVCIRDERAVDVQGRRFRLLWDVSLRTAKIWIHLLHCGIARKSQPCNRRYFFLVFTGEVSAFPSASRHYGIAAGWSHSASWTDVLENLHCGVRKRREVIYHKYTDVVATSLPIDIHNFFSLLE